MYPLRSIYVPSLTYICNDMLLLMIMIMMIMMMLMIRGALLEAGAYEGSQSAFKTF